MNQLKIILINLFRPLINRPAQLIRRKLVNICQRNKKTCLASNAKLVCRWALPGTLMKLLILCKVRRSQNLLVWVRAVFVRLLPSAEPVRTTKGQNQATTNRVKTTQYGTKSLIGVHRTGDAHKSAEWPHSHIATELHCYIATEPHSHIAT